MKKDSPRTPLDDALRAAISNITTPPGDLMLGTGTYERWAVLTLKHHLEHAGFALSETATTMGGLPDRGATSLSVPPSRLSSAELEVLGWRVMHGDGMTRAEKEAAGKVILEVAAETRGEASTPSAIATISLSGCAPRLYGSGGVMGNVGPFGLQIHVDPNMPDDTMEFRDSVSGRLLGKIVNVGRA